MQHRTNPVILNSPLTSQTFQNNKLTTSIWCASLWTFFLNWGPIINWAQGILKVENVQAMQWQDQSINVEYVLSPFHDFALCTITIPKICIIWNTATLHTWKNGSNPFPEMKLDSEIWLCGKRQFTSICCSTITLNTLWSDQIKARRYKGCCKSGNHSLISSSTLLTPYYHGPAMLGAIISSHQPQASSF